MNTVAHSSIVLDSALNSTPLPVEPMCRELADLVAARMTEEGVYETDIPGLDLFRVDAPTSCMSTVYEPSLCVIAQGRKIVQLGDREIVYGALSYMVSSVDLPVNGYVVDASPENPFLAVKINIDPAEVAELVLQLGDAAPSEPVDCPYSACGLCVAQVDLGILDAMTRLVRLLDSPTDARFLAPLIQREIVYRALVGEMGSRMREFVSADSQSHRISRVISVLKDRFAEPLRVRELAEDVNMSESTLYHSFKQVTRMSPVQFQKKLRLHEARRLMLSEGLEAATASYRVGYESPSHFSREYSRMFGAPPRADVIKLRGETRMSVPA
ncbi:AraC family transcriptional regulator [Halopseudomonas pelagia]|uniref:AraC family transcriptional regulator n=2 Tax=Halopseudomonas pelagia TaxID=553151 RepID=A0AA91Z722_9GAMM|nr:AraC family transcriptional regulator [Halopseudomonas pelagia]PCD00427.1 AraC family transcriptional regulator CmrA [Halopseudomonas pelagia]QFY55130.1 AraC family transcriptional regulator [Halopseudomonas pelagia]WOD11440.1 AraC family transcriptional regulator [Pseudomonas sp. NyZ704]